MEEGDEENAGRPASPQTPARIHWSHWNDCPLGRTYFTRRFPNGTLGPADYLGTRDFNLLGSAQRETLSHDALHALTLRGGPGLPHGAESALVGNGSNLGGGRGSCPCRACE